MTCVRCPKCHGDMIYVTAVPHPVAHQMQRITFVCYTCNRTRSYVLPATADGRNPVDELRKA